MNKSASSFGVWLATRRKNHDLTQEQLAQRVGCSLAMIRKIEANERKPSVQIVDLLADALEIAPEKRGEFRQFARNATGADVPKLDQPHHFARAKPQPGNLLAQPNALVGRELEVAALKNRLLRDDARLVTVIGPPGVGKTRLALEAAQVLLSAFSDGAFFVPLTPITEPALVATAVAQALGVASSPGVPAVGVLKQALRDKHILLVLDNFEQVLPAAGFVAQLLAECVWLKVIATSREPLHLRVERQFFLHPLALPEPGAGSMDPDNLSRYASIALFVERAQAAHAEFELTRSNAAAVCTVCRALEGVPLAIELAASWVHLLSCDEIAAEIRRGLDFLSATMQDMPERHRSLRAAFDHSWQLLTNEERQVLSRLTAFRGGFTRDAAERVANATLDVLASLVAKSLLRRNQAGRHDLHEFIRQYAADKLPHEGIERFDETLRAHASYCLDLALLAEPHLMGPQQVTWMDLLELEHDNIRAALNWTLDHAEGEMGMRMAAALKVFWASRAHGQEGRIRLMAQLAAPSARARTSTRLNAIIQAGALAYEDSDYASARMLLDEALSIANELGDNTHMAALLSSSATVAILQADYPKARHAIEQALEIARQSGSLFEQAGTLIGLGDILRLLGEHALARANLEEGIRICRMLNATNLLGYGLRQLCKVVLHFGDADHALALCRESLTLNQSSRSQQGIVACIASLAAIAETRGDGRRATQLLGAVTAQLNLIGTPLLPRDRMDYERLVATLRSRLGEDEFSAAWVKGQAMTVEQAIACAVAETT